jgi:hypothetical protein
MSRPLGTAMQATSGTAMSQRGLKAPAPPKGVWRAQCHFVKRGPAFRAAQGLFSPSAGNGMVPFAAMSVQDTLPCRPQVFGERGVASCDVDQR